MEHSLRPQRRLIGISMFASGIPKALQMKRGIDMSARIRSIPTVPGESFPLHNLYNLLR
jgi:hypothetical protein